MLHRPQAQHGIVHRITDSLFPYHGWGSVCRDENGTLYAVASAFRMQHICPFGKTAMFISRDGGVKWTPPIVLNDSYLDDRDAGIVYLGGGRLLVSWFAHPAEVYRTKLRGWMEAHSAEAVKPAVIGMLDAFGSLPEDKSQGGSFLRISEDYGVTWSDTIRIPVSAPHGPTLCADGTLLYLGKEMYAQSMSPTIPPDTIAAYASRDGGYTWECRGLVEKPAELAWRNLHEPHAIMLPDGTLYGLIRGEGKEVPFGFTMYETLSRDGGRSWSPLRCLGIAGSPPHLLRHSSGALICSFGRRCDPLGERALVSLDNGASWTEEYVLDDNSSSADLGYPCSVEMDDGSILTVYYQRWRDAQTGVSDPYCSLLYTRWRLEESSAVLLR